MWYLSTIRWEVFDDRPEPVYHIKYTESDDGLDWRRPGIVAVELKSPDEGGLSSPSVRKTPDGWEMWYSYRGIRDYRTNPAHSYRIGFATSPDGLRWTRRDDEVGIDVSESGWDSEMIAYARVYEHGGKLHMMYNGNGFGASGIGHAIKDQG